MVSHLAGKLGLQWEGGYCCSVCPFIIFVLGRPFFEAYCNPSTNEFLNERYKSVICIIE